MRLNWEQLDRVMILRDIDSFDHMPSFMEVSVVFELAHQVKNLMICVFSIDCLKAK